MKLRDLMPRLKGVRELVCCGEDYITFESDVLILPDTTFFGWRLFIEERGADGIVAEHSFCKNTDEWGWQDETESRVPENIRQLLQEELTRFKKFLSTQLGVDVQEWESARS